MANPTSDRSGEPLKGSCHCGAVSFQVPGKPKEINECQCTLCRRWAVAWAYYPIEDVTISTKSESSTKAYVWGDKELEFHFCTTCGCVTHWKSIIPNDEMAINTRLMDPEQIKDVDRRRDFDQLSQPLNAKGEAHPDDKAQY